MPALPLPSEFELAILRILWRRELATVRQVFEELQLERQLGYTTVLKTMTILLEKGLVLRDESLRSHVYRATLTEQETQAGLLSELVRNAFGGSAEKFRAAAMRAAPPPAESTPTRVDFHSWRFTMDKNSDLRASERIPIETRVQIRTKGRMACYALAVNISMGGLLLSAAPPLPVGSACKLAIALSESPGAKEVLTEGTVVRSDATGTAIRFASILDQRLYEQLAQHGSARIGNPVLNSYLTYFKVSQSANYAGAEQFLGVSRTTFRNVFLTTFSTCIPLAVLPVWIFHASIPAVPNWLKVVLSFAYGLLWLGLIQPFVDLVVFKYLRQRKAVASRH